jgi:5-methylcytosine-specific restriction endonuclease McrA
MPNALQKSRSSLYFCSKTCSISWKNSELRSGQNHPLWNGGKAIYRKKMEQAPIEVRCQDCGITNKQVLVVHHRDHNRDNNELENLVWLCRNCHYLAHEGKTV